MRINVKHKISDFLFDNNSDGRYSMGMNNTNREIEYRKTIRCWVFNCTRKIVRGY